MGHKIKSKVTIIYWLSVILNELGRRGSQDQKQGCDISIDLGSFLMSQVMAAHKIKSEVVICIDFGSFLMS